MRYLRFSQFRRTLPALVMLALLQLAQLASAAHEIAHPLHDNSELCTSFIHFAKSSSAPALAVTVEAAAPRQEFSLTSSPAPFYSVQLPYAIRAPPSAR